MTLEVLLCTIDERIGRVPDCLLPPTEGVTYLVSFQYTAEKYLSHIPAALSVRKDVRICPVAGKGLAGNRNHALAGATGDLLLLADDDGQFLPTAFNAVRRTFERDPSLDVACFSAVDREGKPLKIYPSQPTPYIRRPKGYYVSSCELVLRRRADLPRFDTRFGLGSDCLGGGEEEVFVHEAYRRGCVVRLFPVVIVATDGQTTGTRFLSCPDVQRSKGAVLLVIYGLWGALLRCFLCSLSFRRRTSSFRLLRNLLAGMLYVLRTRLCRR